jgi:hypothetical protein
MEETMAVTEKGELAIERPIPRGRMWFWVGIQCVIAALSITGQILWKPFGGWIVLGQYFSVTVIAYAQLRSYRMTGFQIPVTTLFIRKWDLIHPRESNFLGVVYRLEATASPTEMQAWYYVVHPCRRAWRTRAKIRLVRGMVFLRLIK